MSEIEITTSPAETEELGRRFALQLERGGIVTLSGPLGAGKTLFAKAVFGALGVDPARVTSPTFSLINRYRSDEDGRLPLYHVDLYRTDAIEDLESLGLDEVFESGGVVLVEWGEKLGPRWRGIDYCITIEDHGDETRHVRISRPEA